MSEQKAWTPDQPLRADCTAHQFEQRADVLYLSDACENSMAGLEESYLLAAREFAAVSVEAVGKPTDAMIRAACFAEAHRRILNWGVAKAAECSEHQRDEIAESFKETARTMLTAALGAAPSPRQRWKDPEASVEAVGRRWADSLEVAKAREAVMEGVTRIARGRAAITTGLADNRSTLLDALCNAVAACYTPKPEKTDAP